MANLSVVTRDHFAALNTNSYPLACQRLSLMPRLPTALRHLPRARFSTSSTAGSPLPSSVLATAPYATHPTPSSSSSPSFPTPSSPYPHKNYPDHVPLNAAQNALLALGSGLVGVMNYTSRPDLIATLSESTASSFLPRLHDAMASHPEGRQILRDAPVLSSETVSLPYLRTLRRGTVGREYVEWLDRDGITPDSREKVRYIDSPTLAYTMLRYRQTHDLYHTLFCLPPTLVHELSLKALEWSNMSLPAAALSSLFGPLRLSAKRRDMWVQDWVPWALRTGAGGRTLVGVYWEKRWEQGIGELRRELGVTRNDHPNAEVRWRGYRELREMERELRRKGEWIDEPEEW